MAAGTGTPTSSPPPPPFPTSKLGSPLFDYDDDDSADENDDNDDVEPTPLFDDDDDDNASSLQLPQREPRRIGKDTSPPVVDVCVGSIPFSEVGYGGKEKGEEEVEKKWRRMGRGPAALVRTGRQ